MVGKGLELPLIVYRDGGVKFIIPFTPSKNFNPFPSCTKCLGKGRVKFILNFNTGKERLNLSFYYGERVKSTVKA